MKGGRIKMTLISYLNRNGMTLKQYVCFSKQKQDEIFQRYLNYRKAVRV